MAVTRQQLAEVLTCHAWSPAGDQLAVCPNSDQVYIHSTTAHETAWPKTATIRGHDHQVTAVDWSAAHGSLVTCSQDRSAIVWQYSRQEQLWQRQRVVMRIRLAALCVRWSPDGTMFAIGSSDKSLSVCHFEQQDAWWACRSLARGVHRSSIVAVAWHPSSQLLATACMDGHCRLLHACGADNQGAACLPICAASKWGDVLLDVPTERGWCTAVAWAPSGQSLAFTAHASTVGIITSLDAQQGSLEGFRGRSAVTREVLPHLPMRTLGFLAEGRIVAAGFDGVPVLLTRQRDDSWRTSIISAGRQDRGKVRAAPARAVTDDFSSKLAMFRSPTPTEVSQASESRADQTAPHAHANAIVELRVLPAGAGQDCQRFSTCGLDGRIFVWDVAEKQNLIAALRMREA